MPDLNSGAGNTPWQQSAVYSMYKHQASTWLKKSSQYISHFWFSLCKHTKQISCSKAPDKFRQFRSQSLHYQCCLDYPMSFAWLGANKPKIKCWSHGTHTLVRLKLLFSTALHNNGSIHNNNHTVVISSDFQQSNYIEVRFLCILWPRL